MSPDTPRDNEPKAYNQKSEKEKFKACPHCGNEGLIGNIFCTFCGIKFENSGKDEDSQMRIVGLSFKEKLKPGKPINISELASADHMKFVIEPGTKFYIESGSKRVEFNSEKIVAAKLAEGKYLNSIDGEVTVCDFEHQKKILDEQAEKDPEMVAEFMKSVAVREASGKRVDEIGEYVKQMHAKRGEARLKGSGSEGSQIKDISQSIKDLREVLIARGSEPQEVEKIINDFSKEVENETDQDIVDLKMAKIMREALQKRDDDKINKMRNKIDKL